MYIQKWEKMSFLQIRKVFFFLLCIIERVKIFLSQQTDKTAASYYWIKLIYFSLSQLIYFRTTQWDAKCIGVNFGKSNRSKSISYSLLLCFTLWIQLCNVLIDVYIQRWEKSIPFTNLQTFFFLLCVKIFFSEWTIAPY